MKKLLLSLCALFAICFFSYGTTVDLSFTNIGTTGWTNSYGTHEYSTTELSVSFTSCSKQTGTITNVPVTKSGNVIFKLLDNKTFSYAKVVLTQWNTKKKTAKLEYSTDGSSFTEFSPAISSSTFSVEAATIPEGTIAIRMSFTETSNQVGIASFEYEITSTGPAKTPVTLTWSKESDSLNFGEAFTAPTLSVDPAEAAEAVVYEASNTELLSVDAEGNMTLTPNVEGTATITASIASDNETYTSNTATYTISVRDPNSPAWYRVDNEKLVVTGVPYAITGGDNKNTDNVCAVLTTLNSTYFNVDEAVAMQADKSIETLPEGTLLFTLEEAATEGKYYIKSGDDYLYYNNSGNSASLGSTKGEYTVTYDAETGFVTLQTGSRYLGYNPSASRFAHYSSAPTTSSSSNQPLRLYYKNGSIVEKTPSQLEYSASEWSVMEGTTDMAGAPELTNPLEIEVVYSSSDEEVAMLEDNGEIVLMGKVGTTVITATPADTDTYSGSASFTLTVTEKPKTPSQLAWSATEWSVMEGTTDMAGAPELTNTLGIAVAYSSSDEDVAMIDEDGTIVLMDKVGTTVITAAPADTDTYSGAVSYTLTVTAKPVLGAITINGTAVEDGQTYTFAEGTELVFASENAEMMEIEAVAEDNTTAFEFLEEAATATWTDAAIGSYMVSVETTGFGQENSALFTIVVTEKPAIALVADFIFAGDNANVTNMASKHIEPTTSTTNGNANDLDGVTFTAENGVTMVINVTGTENHPRYWTNTKTGNEARIYNGNELTISAPESYKLISIEFTKGGGNTWNMTDMTDLLWTNNKAVVKSVTFKTGGRSDLGAVTVTIAHENMPEVPVIEIDGEVITDFEESIDLNKGKKTVTLTAAEGHHIYHKHVAAPAAEAASLYAAEPADDFIHVASNVATTEISTNGTLHFYAQHPESGMKSTVQTLTFHGDSTALFEIEAAESAASEWFDLQGRRVAAPAKGGVYIHKQGSKVSKRAL